MIRVAIDINDTIRAFTNQYALRYQKSGLNPLFDVNNLLYNGDDIYSPFNFKSKEEKEKFQYIDYPFEIYGAANCVDKNIPGLLNVWKNDIDDYEKQEEIELTIIGCDENELSIQATLFFLAKNATRIRKIYFPISTKEVWENFNVVITADPRLIKTKPDNRVIVKIITPYNADTTINGFNKSEPFCYTYKTFIEFLEDKKKWMQILELSE